MLAELKCSQDVPAQCSQASEIGKANSKRLIDSLVCGVWVTAFTLGYIDTFPRLSLGERSAFLFGTDPSDWQQLWPDESANPMAIYSALRRCFCSCG